MDRYFKIGNGKRIHILEHESLIFRGLYYLWCGLRGGGNDFKDKPLDSELCKSCVKYKRMYSKEVSDDTRSNPEPNH